MILMFGDMHGKFGHVRPVVEKEKPTAIILLGDIQSEKPLEQELANILDLTDVWWIHGNHDVDKKSSYDHLFDSELADRNLDGRVVEVNGVRIAGLGGVFREKIWYPQFDADLEPVYPDYETAINEMMMAERYKEMRKLKANGLNPADLPPPPALIGKSLLHKSSIFWNTWMELHGQPADILVTHEAPSCHKNGFVALDVLARSMGVRTMFHGHHHEHIDYGSEEKLGFQAYGVGFRGVTDMNGKVLYES